MAFDDIWNTSYEGIPADSELLNLGANRIRDLKRNIRERGGTDHSWGDTADNGFHNQITFNQAAADPATVASTGYLYTKSVGGLAELFYKDSAGHVEQLTSAGSINVQTFPSGTRMSFLQATPPPGWTQSGVWNDGLIRLVNDGSGGAVGGSWTISGCSVSTSVNTTVSTSTSTSVFDTGSGVSINIGGHTLSTAEIPQHTHNVFAQAAILSLYAAGGANAWGGANTQFFGVTDGGNGGGQPHNHPATGSLSLAIGANSSSNSSASSPASSTFNSNASWRPLYVNACVGVKA